MSECDVGNSPQNVKHKETKETNSAKTKATRPMPYKICSLLKVEAE